MHALGLMSGTSMDGIDVAILETDGERIVARGPHLTVPYDAALQDAIRAALGPAPPPPDLGARIADAHAEAVAALAAAHPDWAARVTVVGFHGHTLFHDPARGITRQAGDGARLAARLGIDVVCDFRAADVAAGGQGAPLAPLYHAALARDLAPPLAVLNIGGIANLTWIGDGGAVVAFDTGPGNALLDDWVRRTTGASYDDGGALAAAGRIDRGALDRLLDDPYFAAPPPKSLDRLDFALDAVAGLSPADGAATLSCFTCETIVSNLRHFSAPPARLLVTGGGRHNRTLMDGLRARLAVPVDPVEAVGWDGDALEAEAFAFLAVRSRRGLPLSVPGTTGVARPTTGGVHHPAAGPERRAGRG